jgi:LuxR family maltose regulon positive regulatory protein
LLSGELAEAARMAQQLQVAATKSNNAYALAWGSYLHALAHYFWNDLGNAEHHFAQAVEQRYVLHTRAAIDSLAGLTLTHQVLGQPDRAKATMALLLEFAQETNNPAYIIIAHSCQARLSLLQGDLASAVRWLQTADLTTDASIMFYWLEIPRITRCRVLIAQGTEASLQKAVDLLKGYRQEVEAQHNTCQSIDILTLQALAYHKQALFDEALVTLERAITLAAPGGFIRPFVELGPSVAGMLERLYQQGVASDYITQIMASFATNDPSSVLRAGEGPTTKALDSSLVFRPSSALIEPLTDRELEVLELLAQRLTNKEIAAQLVISSGTVKQHTHNIYQKLNVTGRRQAVATATELGLLSSASLQR